MAVKGEWAEAIEPITRKCDLAVNFDMHMTFNAAGVDALAKVLRDMAGRLDAEIARQSQSRWTLRRRVTKFLGLCLRW